MSMENSAFQWAEEYVPSLGVGLSRTDNRSAPLWSVDEVLGASPKMKTTIKARTKTEALKFTQNRYPHAKSININGKVQRKK